MNIGIDLDNTITAYPRFFSLFSKAMRSTGCHITVITNREPGTESKIASEINALGIEYDVIHITAEKAQYIIENGISVYFDDTDEYFVELPESILVLKVREEGNFDFRRKKWTA